MSTPRELLKIFFEYNELNEKLLRIINALNEKLPRIISYYQEKL